MAELKVTIGADTTEFMKGIREAGLNINKELKGKPFTFAGAINAATGGLGSMATFAAEAMFGPLGAAISEAFQAALAGVKSLMDYSMRLRNLSYATGLPISKIQQLQNIADTTGIGLDRLAHSMAEFNKKMGEASMRGGETYAAMIKLGYGLDDVKNGTFDYWTAVRALSKAHKAGTDAATLAYYGNQLLGSSYESLLPLIKNSVADLDAMQKNSFTASNESTEAMARLSVNWTMLVNDFKNGMLEITGSIVAFIESIADSIHGANTLIYAGFDPEYAANYLYEHPDNIGKSDAARMEEAKKLASHMTEDQGKEFMDQFKSRIGEGGPKLTPLGLAPAGGASQMQQMGGGDIFGAVAFSPLDAIEKNTADSAQSLRAIANKEAPSGGVPADNPSAR